MWPQKISMLSRLFELTHLRIVKYDALVSMWVRNGQRVYEPVAYSLNSHRLLQHYSQLGPLSLSVLVAMWQLATVLALVSSMLARQRLMSAHWSCFLLISKCCINRCAIFPS